MSAEQAAPVTKPSRVLALLSAVTIGGAERMVFASLDVLVRAGGSVHCIVNDWEYDAVAREAEAIGATWSTGYHRNLLRWRNVPFTQVVRSFASTMETSRRMLKRASQISPTLVFASDHGEILRNAPGLVALRLRRVPVLLYMQNSVPETSSYAHLFRSVIDRLVDHYVVPSRDSESILKSIGVDAQKISYVNNFAKQNERTDEASRDDSKVFFAGQMIPQKGIDILLEAFALVVKNHPRATLDIAAKTEGWIAPEYESYRADVLSRAERADLKGRVTFLGWRNDIPALLRSASVHCAPSRPEMHEGMPLVVLEAKNAAVPTVAPNAGPFREMIEHRVDGWLCSDLSPQSLAEGLSYFLRDADIASRAGEAARASAQKFNQTLFETRWREVLTRIS